MFNLSYTARKSDRRAGNPPDNNTCRPNFISIAASALSEYGAEGHVAAKYCHEVSIEQRGFSE